MRDLVNGALTKGDHTTVSMYRRRSGDDRHLRRGGGNRRTGSLALSQIAAPSLGLVNPSHTLQSSSSYQSLAQQRPQTQYVGYSGLQQYALPYQPSVGYPIGLPRLHGRPLTVGALCAACATAATGSVNNRSPGHPDQPGISERTPSSFTLAGPQAISARQTTRCTYCGSIAANLHRRTSTAKPPKG